MLKLKLQYFGYLMGRPDPFEKTLMMGKIEGRRKVRVINTQCLVSIRPCFKCSVQLLSGVRLFVTPWTAACQASLSITTSRSLLKLMSIKSVMPFNHLIFCCPLLLLSSIFPIIRVFSKESVLCIRWPKYWSFSFSISPSNEYWSDILKNVPKFELV